MPKEFSFNLNRTIRQTLKERIGNKVFDYAMVQRLLKFTKYGSTIVDQLNEITLEYDYLSDIGNLLFFKGYFEENEIIFFSHLLSNYQQPLILDIGANVGLHTVRWAKACPNSKIFAFEPSHYTGAILERNISRNSLKQNVTIVAQAVSDQAGYATFFECQDNAYSSLKDTKRKQVLNHTDVSVTTLDKFVQSHQFDEIALIKIDVEGFEREVINGALDTLKKLKPDLFVEIYGGSDSNPDPTATVELICSLGYQAFVLLNNKVVPFQKHSDAYYNYYFTHNTI